jgi:hypothetical protein
MEGPSSSSKITKTATKKKGRNSKSKKAGKEAMFKTLEVKLGFELVGECKFEGENDC